MVRQIYGITVQKVDVAQWVDELAVRYTNIRLRHQRNRTTVGRIVPSHLLNKLQRRILGDCSKLLRFQNIKRRYVTGWLSLPRSPTISRGSQSVLGNPVPSNYPCVLIGRRKGERAGSGCSAQEQWFKRTNGIARHSPQQAL